MARNWHVVRIEEQVEIVSCMNNDKNMFRCNDLTTGRYFSRRSIIICYSVPLKRAGNRKDWRLMAIECHTPPLRVVCFTLFPFERP